MYTVQNSYFFTYSAKCKYFTILLCTTRTFDARFKILQKSVSKLASVSIEQIHNIKKKNVHILNPISTILSHYKPQNVVCNL